MKMLGRTVMIEVLETENEIVETGTMVVVAVARGENEVDQENGDLAIQKEAVRVIEAVAENGLHHHIEPLGEHHQFLW